MQRPSNIKIIFGLALLAFGMVSLWAITMLKPSREQTEAAQAARLIDELRAKATKGGTVKPTSEAIAAEAAKAAVERLNEANIAPDERLKRAANMFLGFYEVNTNTRRKFCQDQGVDIQPFVAAFKQKHLDLLMRAQKVATVQLSAQDAPLGSPLYQFVAADMQDLAKSLNTGVKGACEALAAHADSVAEDIFIGKAMPQVHEILMGSP